MSPDSHALPVTFSRADLTRTGFTGWQTWNTMRAEQFQAVPDDPAGIVILRRSSAKPSFLDTPLDARLSARAVSPHTLAELWLPRAHVVYIAGADPARRRLARMARLGAGELREAHWGGRHIWQLADHDELLVAWHAITWDETPTGYAKRLLARFAELHGGRLPFANHPPASARKRRVKPPPPRHGGS